MTVSPATTLLAAQLRSGSPKEASRALARLRRAIVSAGSLRGAAEQLGVPARTLERWALRGHPQGLPAVAGLVDELGLRRSGPRVESEKESAVTPLSTTRG